MVKILGFGPRDVQPRTAFDHYSARDAEDDYDVDYEEMTRCTLQVVLDDVDRALFGDCPGSRAGCEAASAVCITEAHEWRRALPHLRARGHALCAPAVRVDSEGGGCSADGASGASSHTAMQPQAYRSRDGRGRHGQEVQGEDEDVESMGAGSASEEEEHCELQRPTHPLAYVPPVLGDDFGGLVVRGIPCPLTDDGPADACLGMAMGRCSFREGGGGEGALVDWRHSQASIDASAEGVEFEEEVIASHGILEEIIAAQRARPPPLPVLPAHASACAPAATLFKRGHALGRSPTPEVTELRLANELGLPPRSPALAIRHHVISDIVDRCWHALMPLLSLLPELVAHELQARAGGQHASRRPAALRNSCSGGVCCVGEVRATGRAARGILARTQASADSAVLTRAACLPLECSPFGSPIASSLPLAPGLGLVQHPQLHAPPGMSAPLVPAPPLGPASRSVAQPDETHGGFRPPASSPVRVVGHLSAPIPRQSARQSLDSLSSKPRTAGTVPQAHGPTQFAYAGSRDRRAPMNAEFQLQQPRSANQASAGQAPLVPLVMQDVGCRDGRARAAAELVSHPQVHSDRKGRPVHTPYRAGGRGSPAGQAGGLAGGSALDSHRGWSEGTTSVHGQAVRRGAVPPSGRPLPAPYTSARSGRPRMPHLQRGLHSSGALIGNGAPPRRQVVDPTSCQANMECKVQAKARLSRSGAH
jgi:hypothetical protein